MLTVLRTAVRNLLRIVRDTQKVFADNEMAVYAGYTALYILMAMVPLLTLMIGLVNLLPTLSLQHMEEVILQLMPDIDELKDMLHTIVNNVDRRAGSLAVSVSLVAALWSASNGVNALQVGLQKIHGTKDSFFKRRGSALLYTLLFLALIPALFIFRVLRSSIEELIAVLNRALNIPDIAGRLLDFMDYSGLITAGAMFFVLLLAYTYLQGGRQKLRCQLPGAVFSTLLWLAFSSLFEIFIARFWQASSLYGSLAAIFLAAMWLKSITTILFYGAALNEALNRRRAEKKLSQ